MAMTDLDRPRPPSALRRGLSAPLLVFYGLGVTIGAGIYVLVGATAAEAGMYAPVSFVLAAVVVAFTGLSYAELATRFPVSAGEAAYVLAGFGWRGLALAVGLLVTTAGVVSAAAVSIGAAAYLQDLVPLPVPWLTAGVILLLGLAAAWGIVESVGLASMLTILEVGGLGFVVYHGLAAEPHLLANAHRLIPPLDLDAWSGIASASLLAFFAFIGFEDIVNVAEEARDPHRSMPIAILGTLLATTVIYVAVVSVVVLAVPLDILSASSAPLALVFELEGGRAGLPFTIVATIATLNGVLIQLIMASRVLYGLSNQGALPVWLGRINPVTRTPLYATGLVVSIVLVLALAVPIAELAAVTSQLVLVVFVVVNLALIRLKRSAAPCPAKAFRVGAWAPTCGFATSLFMLVAGSL
jgi:APA family basic amino acid/polyamine antiporter